MGPDLMSCELDFKIYITNKHYDVLFGRVDEWSLSSFPWLDVELDALAADVLEGGPIFVRAASPCNALPPLKPVYEGDEEWEPLGFGYLKYLKDTDDMEVCAHPID